MCSQDASANSALVSLLNKGSQDITTSTINTSLLSLLTGHMAQCEDSSEGPPTSSHSPVYVQEISTAPGNPVTCTLAFNMSTTRSLRATNGRVKDNTNDKVVPAKAEKSKPQEKLKKGNTKNDSAKSDGVDQGPIVPEHK